MALLEKYSSWLCFVYMMRVFLNSSKKMLGIEISLMPLGMKGPNKDFAITVSHLKFYRLLFIGS